MGVITVVDIDYGRIFGPFPITRTGMDPTYAIGMLTQDKKHQGPAMEIDPSNNNGLARGMDWLAYISPARNEDEQNMEAYVKNKEVFYRALRIIKAGEELLVWYSKDFCQLIDIPDVKRIPLTESEKYICSQCGETYGHIFTLKAHMKFKCEIGSSTSTRDRQNNLFINSRKRHLLDEDESSHKVFVKDYSNGTEKLTVSKDYRDVNSNVSQVDREKQDLSASAFRKVEKIESPTQNDKHVPTSRHSINKKPELTFEKDIISMPAGFSSHQISNKDCFVPPDMISSLMVPPTVITSSGDIHSKVMDSYNFGLAYPFPVSESMVRNLDSLSPNSKKHYLMNSGFVSSIPFTKSANPMVEKILQTSNLAMLHKPLPALTQSTNWCAKCNTSFRMTSDLVYHMRSHHSKESPTTHPKRDEKLKCNICHETFKERHHLTRHMTSHQ